MFGDNVMAENKRVKKLNQEKKPVAENKVVRKPPVFAKLDFSEITQNIDSKITKLEIMNK